ncbi:MAG: DUF6737 family protein [Coleofasciculaceae cyanobacterium]
MSELVSRQKPINPWSYKPWWCQPWSILLTGTMIIASSWVLAKAVWLTVIISCPILVWWTYFLWLWPELIRKSGILENHQSSSQDFISQVRDSGR